MKSKTLRLNNISKEYLQSKAHVSIFKNLNYTFQSATSYAIMGPSGVGKSTLLHILAGIESADQGHVEINDQVINQHNFEKRIAALHGNIGLVFQQPCLIHELSVLENVILNALANNNFDNSNYEHGKELLDSIGLLHKADSSVSSLSGGQQQRIAILRALFHRPSFILADEPTGNLDKDSANQIMELLITYQKKYVMGLIISTHDIEIAKLCDLILKIEDQNLVSYRD
jgi:putative ABC transport system ATP-binding protein